MRALILILIAIFVILVGLIWLNRAGDEALSNAVKNVFLPMGAAIVLFCTALFSNTPKIKETIPVIIFYDTDHKIIPVAEALSWNGSLGGRGYKSVQETFAGWNNATDPKKVMTFFDKQSPSGDGMLAEQTYFVDLLELSLWDWLTAKYGIAWQTEKLELHQIQGPQSMSVPINEREQNPRILTDDDLRRLLTGNVLLKTGWKPQLRVSIPSGSTVTRSQPSVLGSRTTEIKNRNMTLKITVSGTGFSGPVRNDTKLEKSISDKYGSGLNYKSAFFEVELNVSPWLRWSPETIQRQRWGAELIAALKQDFDWRVMQSDLQDALSTSALAR